jgi:dipeptidyl aminopeptidase/acylaminoacyl peptidase
MFALPVHAQEDLAGAWTGVWTRGGDTLAVDVVFERAGESWRGTFDSDRLRVVGIPFTETTYDPPKVTIVLAGDATTLRFEGELHDDRIAGTLREDTSEGTFLLIRRATTPPLSREEPVSFDNGGVRLAGSLILPAGEGPYPAVVFLHGSGGEGRWASRYLSARLARAGYASLIYDKRGVGESTGDWRTVGFEDLAADTRAAVSHLAARSDIDPARIGIHGHSQGGTIAPMIAAGDSLVAFVIASAPSGVPMADAEIFSVMNSIEDEGLPPEDAELAGAYVRELVAVAYHGAARSQLDSLTAAARGRSWFFEPPAPDSHYWTFSRRIAAYDPAAAWRRVEVPVLVLFGERDRRVPPAPGVESIVRALLEDGEAHVSVRVFPEADHTFRVPGAVWPRTVAGYPDAVLAWLVAVVGA